MIVAYPRPPRSCRHAVEIRNTDRYAVLPVEPNLAELRRIVDLSMTRTVSSRLPSRYVRTDREVVHGQCLDDLASVTPKWRSFAGR
jgi:hypothetical protein